MTDMFVRCWLAIAVTFVVTITTLRFCQIAERARERDEQRWHP